MDSLIGAPLGVWPTNGVMPRLASMAAMSDSVADPVATSSSVLNSSRTKRLPASRQTFHFEHVEWIPGALRAISYFEDCSLFAEQMNPLS